MANNRLYIIDVNTGEQLLIAKGWGYGKWEVHVEREQLQEWLNDRSPESADMNGTADLIALRTEKDLL